MDKATPYKDKFIESLSLLTGIAKEKIEDYAKENNPFNILEHPTILEPTKRQYEKIATINEFLTTYGILQKHQDENKVRFTSPQDVADYFIPILGKVKDREKFMTAFLNTKNKIIEVRTISEGTINASLVDFRKMLKQALANSCSSIMLCHNHPSGETQPSLEDISTTQRIVDIFGPLGIKVHDHVIVGDNTYTSLKEKGIMPSDRYSADYQPSNVAGIKENNDDFCEDEEDLCL